MYCTQCTSRQVSLMCTQQRLGWGFVRPGRTHTHGCLRSHATYLTPHTPECYVWAVGRMRACVISRNIVVNPQWYELTCIAHKCTSRQVLLMCTQRLGWKFVRPGRTHMEGCLHSHATYLTLHTGMLCLGRGPHV